MRKQRRQKTRHFHIARFGPVMRKWQNYGTAAGRLKKRYIFDRRDRYQLIEDGNNWEQAISPGYIPTDDIWTTRAQDVNLYKELRKLLRRKGADGLE